MERLGVEVQAEVTAFVNQARTFCEFIHGASAASLSERLSGARQRLLGLYAAGAALPHVEPPEGDEDAPTPEAPKAWPGFGPFETYWEVFDPYVEESPVAATLSDDLLDVYRDVRRGLDLWDQDLPRSAAIWHWRFHFEIHWGAHAIDALRALHRACTQERAT